LSTGGRTTASAQRRKPMPFVTVGQENSGNIDIYYEDHGSGDQPGCRCR
jgi:hypothetical protein